MVHGLSPNCENQSPWGLIILYSRGVRLIYMVGHKQHTSVLSGSDQRNSPVSQSKQVKLIPFNPWGVHFQQNIWVFGKKCCLSKLRKCVRHSLDFNCMKQMCESVDRDFHWQAFISLYVIVHIHFYSRFRVGKNTLRFPSCHMTWALSWWCDQK